MKSCANGETAMSQVNTLQEKCYYRNQTQETWRYINQSLIKNSETFVCLFGTTSVWPTYSSQVKKGRCRVYGGRWGRREYIRLRGNFHWLPSPAWRYNPPISWLHLRQLSTKWLTSKTWPTKPSVIWRPFFRTLVVSLGLSVSVSSSSSGSLSDVGCYVPPQLTR